MKVREERLLRVEEIVFIALLAVNFLIHAVVREPYYIFYWFGEKWYGDPSFRIFLIAGTACVGTAAFLTANSGTAGREALSNGAMWVRNFLPFIMMPIPR